MINLRTPQGKAILIMTIIWLAFLGYACSFINFTICIIIFLVGNYVVKYADKISNWFKGND